jgi:hypothetical protein
MQVTTDLQRIDHQAFTRHVWYSGARGGWVWFIMIFLAALAVTVAIQSQAHIRMHTPTMLTTMFVLLGYLSLAQRRIRPNIDGVSLGIRTYKLVDEGLLERSRHHEHLTRWSGFCGVDETKTHIFVFIDNCQAHIIPKRGFAEESQCAAFVEELRSGAARVARQETSVPASFAATVA